MLSSLILQPGWRGGDMGGGNVVTGDGILIDGVVRNGCDK